MVELTKKTIECSAQDDREYKAYILPENKLHVLLISDPNTDKSAAAMDVRVGSNCDPDDLPGLAHFCEHMLFMGTTKYPDENDYNVYLNSHGGNSNAFTDLESTNYYLDIHSEFLEGALDRFAQFFSNPLFTESATERELQAIDSEHGKNILSDYWRLFQLSKQLCIPTHPFHKFGTGNLETLSKLPEEKGINVRDALIDFHSKYYSANLMKLVVLGNESISELTDMVHKYFTDIPNSDLERPKFPGNPFPSPDYTQIHLQITPIKEIRNLEMNFPMREIDSWYLSKPHHYISHLLGHEGTGSVLALLKKIGLANELAVGESRQCSDWSMFSVCIELTDAGMNKVQEVAAIIFHYLDMLREAGPQQWVHEETSTVADCNFRFLSKRNPMDYVCSLAGNMQTYPEHHVLSGPYKIYEYNPDAIVECLSYLVPSNLMLFVSSKTFSGKTTCKEPIYGTEYSKTDFPDFDSIDIKSLINDNEGNSMLSFPEKNDMIATNFALKEVDGLPKDEPKLLIDSNVCRLWYKPDNVFSMPKMNVIARMKTPVVNESPAASVLTSLYVQLLQEHCTDFTYLASMASLHCSFVNDSNGIELHVSGFSEKLNILVGRIVDAMIAFPDKLETELFDRIKDKVSKNFTNFLFSQPYSHAFYAGDLCLETAKHSIHDKISALSTLTVSSLISFSNNVLSRFHLEMLVHGNANPDDAKAISSTIINKLNPQPLFSSCIVENRIVQLDSSVEYIHRLAEYNPDDANSCLNFVLQVGQVDIHTNAILAFVHHLMKEPAFNELRSSEQLGYIVHTSVKTNGDDIKGLLFLIQSDAYDPIHLDTRVEAFIERFRQKIVSMSAEEFQENKDAVMEKFLEKNKNLAQESTKYWSAIYNKSYLFRKHQLIAEEMKDISLTEVLTFFDKYVAHGGKNRKKFSTQVFGKDCLEKMEERKDDENSTVKYIGAEDAVNFKRGMSLYSLPTIVDVSGMKFDS